MKSEYIQILNNTLRAIKRVDEQTPHQATEPIWWLQMMELQNEIIRKLKESGEAWNQSERNATPDQKIQQILDCAKRYEHIGGDAYRLGQEIKTIAEATNEN